MEIKSAEVSEGGFVFDLFSSKRWVTTREQIKHKIVSAV